MGIKKVEEAAVKAATREAENAHGSLARIAEQLAKTIGAQAHAETVFGKPITREQVTIIPVARAIGAFGAGAGSGGGAEGSEARLGGGFGTGGGGGFVVSAVGMIEITPDGARFQPFGRSIGIWTDVRELMRVAIHSLRSKLQRL
ncbi:MAG TPA: spore germination protein GerW family protein [Polyangiales bacterium]|nr:spore germination protein GerW family protein [Polyangiales bacterium]